MTAGGGTSSSSSDGKCGRKDATAVLILGAGMTGISVGKVLSDNNVTDFIIFEAEDRIGGRVKSTILESGVRVELGANWIQGIDPEEPEKHPLWSIAQTCGGVGGRFMQTFPNATVHAFDEDGTNITNSTLFRSRLAEWNAALDPGLDSLSTKRQEMKLPDISVREALKSVGWVPKTPLDNLIEWYGFDLDEYASPPEEMSLYQNIPDDTYFDFGNANRTQNYLVTDQEEGFAKVVTCLAKTFLSKDDPRLHLNSTVTEIDWSDSDCVCVTVTESGHSSKQYCGSYAVVTFSLGVLKSDVVKFVPALPAAKQTAINHGKFCLYLKIFMEFDEIFWQKDVHVDNFIHVDSIRGHYVEFEPLTDSVPILFATVTSEMVEEVYRQPVEETTEQLMKVLRIIYGPSIPSPKSVTFPDWWENPLFQGMYSNPPVGFTDEDWTGLSKPVGRLHFGGEATSEPYAGYVHGAYFSGIDVAKEILKRHSSFQ